MKAYVITTVDSKRLIDGEIRDYPEFLPECEVFYGPVPDDKNYPPPWFKCIRPKEIQRRHAWCCYLSKIYCLQEHIKRYPDEDCIIFEDDVIFLPHFEEVYTGFMQRVPEDWAILWFEYQTKATGTEVKPGVLKLPWCWASSMLVFRSKYIPDIIEDLKGEFFCYDCEVDRILSELADKYPSYVPLFSVCGQRNGYSYIGRHSRKGHYFTSTKYKSLNGTIKYSTEDDYKIYLE